MKKIYLKTLFNIIQGIVSKYEINDLFTAEDQITIVVEDEGGTEYREDEKEIQLQLLGYSVDLMMVRRYIDSTMFIVFRFRKAKPATVKAIFNFVAYLVECSKWIIYEENVFKFESTDDNTHEILKIVNNLNRVQKQKITLYKSDTIISLHVD